MNVVTSDLWQSFMDLYLQNEGNLAKTENDGCWPTLIDEFCALKKIDGF